MDDRDLHDVDEPGREGERTLDEARAGAREAFEAGKARTRSFLEEQKDVLAGRVGGIADALHSCARDLGGRPDEASSSAFVDGAARRLDSLSRSLRERDARALISDAETFARRSPGVFVGSALAAGFLLARFLKSSRESLDDVGPDVEPEPSPEPHTYADRPGRTC